MVVRYGNLNLVKEYKIDWLFALIGCYLGIYSLVIVYNLWHKPIVYLPHLLVLIAYVVISDINDERIRHNNRILYDILTIHNRITFAARKAHGYVH